MANHALASVSRNDRRILLRNEERRRKSGDWGPWEKIDLPMGFPGRGWCNLVRTAYRNAVFSVLVRTVEDGVKHFAVSSLTGVRPTWWEMQRIKNDLAGEAATAVEVYPPQAEVIDGADMFHIWVTPTALPFSLWKDERL